MIGDVLIFRVSRNGHADGERKEGFLWLKMFAILVYEACISVGLVHRCVVFYGISYGTLNWNNEVVLDAEGFRI